jgi:putative SOS response-associated peptidase YedK
MCGRYVTPQEAEMERYWRIDRRSPHPFSRRFNVAPTTTVPMLMHEDGELTLHAARWGLVPHWWKQPKPPALTFNARSEEAASKPMWRHAYRNSRCLMPAEGWYEWNQGERVDPATGEILKVKQPHYIYRTGEPVFAFAGLLSHWTNPDGESVLSCAVLTKAAAPSLTDVHDRMPVVLLPEQYEEWISPALTDADAVALLIADAQTDFAHHVVSTRVNNARNESADLIERNDA